MSFGETLNPAQSANAPSPAERRVDAHTRKVATKEATSDEDSVPFFGESRVLVELIEVPASDLAGLSADVFENIGHND